MAPRRLGWLSRTISNTHFWILVALFAICIILHYPQQIFSVDSTTLFSFLGLTRHAIERLLLLVPITYTGLTFGLRGGLAGLAFALAIMLPRVFLISLYLPDALLETAGIIIIGGLVNLWIEGYRKELKNRQQMVTELKSAEDELQSRVQLIRNNEKRLSALNEVSTIVSQSLELEDVLNAAADKVMEIVNLEVVLVFLLDEDGQELELKTYRGVSEDFARGVKGLKVGEGLNGWVAQTGEPLVVEDASHDSRLTRQVVHQEGIRAGLIVPLIAKGRVLGTLTAAARGSRQFMTDEIELLSIIGRQVGIAIENAHLYQKEHLMLDVQKQMGEHLRFYIQQITRAQEEERKRIARELHDDTAQELVALSRRIDRLISSAQLSARNISFLEEIRQQSDKILDGVRRFSQDLRPSILDDLGLVPALEWLVSDLSSHFKINIGMGLLGSVRRFDPDTELVLFRIAQEALRNVCKHSTATRAWLTLEYTEDKAILTIKDNGKGFLLPERIGDLASTGKLGLAGMKERAQLIGGNLTIQSDLGKGSTVTIEIPG